MTKMQIPQPTPDEYQRIKSLLSSFSGQFMTPEIYEGDYVQIESDTNGCTVFPATGQPIDIADDECTQDMHGILIRLSASGYLDCTEWEPMGDWSDVIARLQEWADESNG
jgi:hypothetical protein